MNPGKELVETGGTAVETLVPAKATGPDSVPCISAWKLRRTGSPRALPVPIG